MSGRKALMRAISPKRRWQNLPPTPKALTPDEVIILDPDTMLRELGRDLDRTLPETGTLHLTRMDARSKMAM